MHMIRMEDLDNREAHTINFVRELFQVLRYRNELQKRFMMIKQELRYMASQGRRPQVDACILDNSLDGADVIGRQSGQVLARV